MTEPATPAVPSTEGVTPEPVTAPAVTPGVTTPAAPADAFAAEREQLEARARALQSRADKAEALLEAAKPKPDPAPEAEPLTAAGVLALLQKDRAMTEARASLKAKFPSADPALLTQDFASVEALEAAVEDSHLRIEAVVTGRVGTESQALLARYVEKYGALPDAPGGGDNSAEGVLPTKAELREYTVAQLNAFVAKHGEDTLNRIIKGV